MSKHVRIKDVSGLVTVQDLGRPGFSHYGICPSGAADARSLKLANRLVGNAESNACLEITGGGIAVKAVGDLICAVTGAHTDVSVDGRISSFATRVLVRNGQTLRVQPPVHQLRPYVAFRGGIDVAPAFGSCSTDTMAQLGRAPVRAGDVLDLATPCHRLPAADFAPLSVQPSQPLRLRVVYGPRDDWFTPAARETLVQSAWEVTAKCSRVGVHLSGPRLVRIDSSRELESEGASSGAIQVPPSGQPIVFLADYPVTGGYPIIGYLRSDDVAHLAQARPGHTLRFHAL